MVVQYISRHICAWIEVAGSLIFRRLGGWYIGASAQISYGPDQVSYDTNIVSQNPARPLKTDKCFAALN